MKFVVLVFSIATLFFAPLSISSPLHEEVLTELVRKSGGDEQTKRIPETMLSSIERYRSSTFLTDEIYGQLVSDIHRHFNHDDFIQRRKLAISAVISAEEAEFLLDWFNSELGKRIAEAEVNNTNSDTDRAIYANKEALMADASGVRFSERLDETLGLLESQLEQSRRDLKILSKVLNLNLQKSDSDELTEAQLEFLRREIRMGNTLWAVQTYSGFTESEKYAYLAFLGSDIYQKFFSAIQSSANEYITEFGVAFVTAFSDFLFKDQFKLHSHLVVSYPQGENLTFQSYEDGGPKFLMGWTGEERDFEFVYAELIPEVVTTELFWQAIDNAHQNTYVEGTLELVSSGEAGGEWGADVEYRVFVPENLQENYLFYFRIFNHRTNYIVSAVAFDRNTIELNIQRTLRIMQTAKVLK